MPARAPGIGARTQASGKRCARLVRQSAIENRQSKIPCAYLTVMDSSRSAAPRLWGPRFFRNHKSRKQASTLGLGSVNPGKNRRPQKRAVCYARSPCDSSAILLKRLWMYNRDIGIAREVANVQGKQMRDPVDVHRGDQSRIVYLRSRNRVIRYQSPPFGVDEFVFG